MIKLSNISKVFRTGKVDFCALRDICFQVLPGEFVAIQGSSGSGKTTLLNIIGCLDTCSEGSYLLDGKQVSHFSDEELAAVRNSKVGFIFQDFALVNDRTALYNVMLPLLLGKTPYKTIKNRAVKILEEMDLGEHMHKKINQMSGGQKQRVAIARAIINDPDIILADEPTGQLDSKTGQQIMQILKNLNKKGKTVVLVTHDEAVAVYADRRVILADGQIRADTSAC